MFDKMRFLFRFFSFAFNVFILGLQIVLKLRKLSTIRRSFHFFMYVPQIWDKLRFNIAPNNQT